MPYTVSILIDKETVMERFSVDFYDGDDDRLPEWCVVEWAPTATGRVGTKLKSFYSEAEAEEYLYVTRMEYAFGGSDYMNL
jgi:hypothetical protein